MRTLPYMAELEALAGIEAQLCQLLTPFVRFGGHALYYGQSLHTVMELLSEEKRLLLPLATDGETTAILRLDDVDPESARAVMPYLPGIIELCQQNIFLQLDNETGLETEQSLLEQIAEAIESGRGSRKNELCLGLVVIRWPDGAAVRTQSDEKAFKQFWNRLARKFKRMLPQDATGARLGRVAGRNEFAVLFAATGRDACNRLAEKIISALERETFFEPLSGACMAAYLVGGHALYPQDMRGNELVLPAWRQALIFRERALLAADTTVRTAHRTFAYAWVRAAGGEILEMLPGNFLKINLGINADIQPGQHFHIIGKGQPRNVASSKGQIVVRKVGESDSIAELFHVRHADSDPAPGDGLLLIQPGSDNVQDPAGILLQHAEFLNRFNQECRRCSRFTLSVTKLWILESDDSIGRDSHIFFQQQLAKFCKTFFLENLQNGFAGWYGSDGVIIFFPNASMEMAFYENMHTACSACGLGAATGIYTYPFLNFSKEDSETNALKALAYAELLPEPHIGVMDAQALAISGDKKFSQGDEPGALSEYTSALLLKPGDPLFMNSLGVCLAALNRVEAAKQVLLEALDHCQESGERSKINYNLGNLFLRDNDLAAARRYYKQCIRSEPDHVYAWARLGQIYCKAGRLGCSRALYRRAAALTRGEPEAFNMVQRQLARLEAARNQTEKAREILHDTLLRNPDDHASLLLLARTYLEDEPAMAEILARKCLRLGGDAWDVLTEALTALGRNDDAKETAWRRGNA